MKKVVVVIICIVLIILIGLYCKRVKKTEVNSDIIETEEGMKVTIIGGSNMEDKGNINSAGYIIRSKNNQLIIVDGGRDVDAEIIFDYIIKLGNGTVNHWYITHPHHIGALIKLLDEKEITVENLYYSFNSDEWYKEYDKRGYEVEHSMIEHLNNKKIKNRISCTKDQIIEMDNIECEIIRIANPEVTKSDNGNDSSMVFKMTAKDVNKSMIFLGDAFTYTTKELLENTEKLKADAVQMAHHGQNGVNRAVYEAIDPELCFFNCPKWLYDNNLDDKGYDTGDWQTIEVRSWLEAMGTTNILAYEGDQTIKFTSEGFEKI